MKRQIIIGTAGHIDHGKTALIRALTGRETDRLKEEKQRGISIDLGFTHYDLASGERIGFIDVPGHERLLPICCRARLEWTLFFLSLRRMRA